MSEQKLIPPKNLTDQGDQARDGRPRLLVVEDSEDLLMLFVMMIESMGYEVETAVNGREGYQLAVKKDFDLILMDLQMPELDGFEATRKLREAGMTIPIIALSAHAFKEEVLRAIASGCNAHIRKPVSRQILVETIERHLPDFSTR